MKRRIKYKGIVQNVLNDAPFIGAVVIANSCSMPCADCINGHLKAESYCLEDTAADIIAKVKSNGLNQGIVLSGLEWTEQPDDLIELARTALEHHLEVMVYTHHNEHAFFSIVPELASEKIYVQFGLFDKALSSDTHYSYGVKLATTNQYIKQFGQ